MVFHAQIATENGSFELADVIRDINRKLRAKYNVDSEVACFMDDAAMATKVTGTPAETEDKHASDLRSMSAGYAAIDTDVNWVLIGLLMPRHIYINMMVPGSLSISERRRPLM